MSRASADKAKIEWLLNHGVENVFPSKDALREKLLKGERIRLYLGIDPTGPSLHLGHAINLQKLAEFQELGHEVILLIGDFTAMIGDPTDKSAARKKLTREEVLANCKQYKEQAGHILGFSGKNAAELKFNGKWLSKMPFAQVVELASHFTVQQMIERDMFEKRIGEGKPVHLHEFLYPLMQGYDSVAMDVDLEVGGNDQTFNMLAGRDLQKSINQKEKFVVTMKLIADPSGVKMGKSEGNMISFADAPEDAYGKVMSWSDPMILPGYELCTMMTQEEVSNIRRRLDKGENPMSLKKELAKRVVAWMMGNQAASKGASNFEKVHQEHERPEVMDELEAARPSMLLIDALVQSELCDSKSDARRQIEQGGVKVDDEVVEDVKATVKPGSVIQKGKRHFVKLV